MLALLSLALAACAGGIKPAVKPVDTQSLGLSQTVAPAVDAQWWKGFGDPQLDSLIDEAVNGNPTLDEAVARMRLAQAGLAAARSQQYPQVSFDANEQREHFANHYIFPPPYAGTARWIGTFAGNLNWDIDLWGRQAALVDRSKALGRAARLDTAGAKLAIEGAVAAAYVELNEAFQLADVAKATVEEREHVLAIGVGRVKDGIDSKVELTEAQTLLDVARKNAEQANSNCDLAVHALAALMGRGANAYAEITHPAGKLHTTLALPTTLPADLLARRPDIASAQERIYAAMKGRIAARAAFYPDINLLATAGFASIGLGNLLTQASEQYGAGPAVHLPIFDAGKLRADYESATADLDFAIADYNATVTQAVHETADQLTQIRSLDAQVVQQTRFSADAAEGYRLAKSRYRSGLANQLTLFNAEALLLEARRQQAELDAARTTECIHLILAIGGGFNPAGISIPAPQQG